MSFVTGRLVQEALCGRLVTVSLIGALVLALSQLSGCATAGGGAEASGQDMTTESDESPVRKRARTRLELAMNYFEQGQTRVALDEVKQSLVQDPNYAEALNLRGLIFMRLNDPRLAEESFKQALAINPKDGNALHNLGWLTCQQGKYAEAAGVLAKALATPGYQSRPKTLMAQGICEVRAGRLAEAEQSFVKSYELDPGNPVTGYNLANLLFRRGDLVRAQFYIRRLNNGEFANPESLWLGIKVERRLQSFDAVRQLSEQLSKRFGQSREMQLLEKGSFDE
jgi:type IV pilus assembly protein PilF